MFDPGIHNQLSFRDTVFFIWDEKVEQFEDPWFDPQGRKRRRMNLDRIRYTNTELKWKENVKNIGTGDLRHRLVYLQVSQLQASCLLQVGLDRNFANTFADTFVITDIFLNSSVKDT